ncbi:glycoside hydrolase family 5 protein [Planctomycetes bacterium CA13]
MLLTRCRFLLITLCLSAFVFVARAEQTSESAKPNAAIKQPQHLGRGVNILGYDGIWKSKQTARFKEHYFEMIRQAGFDHVRINLHPLRDHAMESDHRLSDKWLATLDWAVNQSLAADLKVILDFHEFNTLGRAPDINKQSMLAFWRQISERYKDKPDEVVFEILNEPNKKLTADLWNQYFREALAIIRKTNPTRTVIIGPASWNNINALDTLELPEEDRLIVVTVHYYNPFAFTHQGAGWTDLKDKLGVTWDATADQKQAIIDDFAKAQAWANEHDRPMYVGEFGAYDKGDMDSRVRWTSFVTRHLEELGWSWGYWQFDGDFIVYDIDKEHWVEPIRNALSPPKQNQTSK